MIDLTQLDAALVDYELSMQHAVNIKTGIELLKAHKETAAALGICYQEAFQKTMVKVQKVQKVQSFGVSVKQAYELVKGLRAA